MDIKTIKDICIKGIKENSEAVAMDEDYANGKSEVYSEILNLIQNSKKK